MEDTKKCLMLAQFNLAAFHSLSCVTTLACFTGTCELSGAFFKVNSIIFTGLAVLLYIGIYVIR